MSSELNKNTKIVDATDIGNENTEDNCYGYFSTYEKNTYVHICESLDKSDTSIVNKSTGFEGCILYSLLTSKGRRSSTIWRSGSHKFFYTNTTTFGQLCDDIRRTYGVIIDRKLIGKEKDDIVSREW